MRRVGQVRKRDIAEKPIIAALRQIGAEVWPVSTRGGPDLLVRYRGQLHAWEVKTGKGKRTAAQEVSQFPVVRDVDEALRAVGC